MFLGTNRQTGRRTTKGSPSGGEGRADSSSPTCCRGNVVRVGCSRRELGRVEGGGGGGGGFN